jgi:hypothetical protein
MLANIKNKTTSMSILSSALMVMVVIVIATMNTPNAFATIDDNENSLNVKVVVGYPVLSEERDLRVCVDVYTSEIQTNYKEITLPSGTAATANIGTFTFHNVPVGIDIKACVFDPTSNADVDNCELTSNSLDKSPEVITINIAEDSSLFL